uniref:Uncharacterized protein n=1 Tax=Arundo donax TaxID=35708 RepID=A0A0A9CDP6_ARUDO
MTFSISTSITLCTTPPNPKFRGRALLLPISLRGSQLKI